jgi:hypothetical protein
MYTWRELKPADEESMAEQAASAQTKRGDLASGVVAHLK